MTAQVIYLQNALVPSKRETVHRRPTTIRRLAPKWNTPYIAMLNGLAVRRADWGRRLCHGDTLAFVDAGAFPQGGGGGGSNPLRIILMIVVMVFAWWAGPVVGAMFGSTAVGSMATMAIGMIGSALVNAMLPPPGLPSTQQMAAQAAASPTYSLNAQGNTARIGGAIPEHFGRMIGYLDFAAQPYVEYFGNEQYLYQLLCIGRGEYDIEAIRIEDTDIAAFDEITYEVIPPNGALTLFPANVISSIEVSGQELGCGAGTYTRSGATVTITQAGHGLSTGKWINLDFTSGGGTDGDYQVVTAPSLDTFTITDTASGTTSGDVTVSIWIGGFIANPAGSAANYLGIDFVLPRGLYYANDDGSLATDSVTVTIQFRSVDDNGTPTSGWTTSSSPTYSAATSTPQRKSERHGVAGARYEVRARRVDIKEVETRYGNDIVWASLRSYLPETRTYGYVTLIAMRMRASNNLSMQASRKVNVIATRKLPIWNGSTWSALAATRSPAWAFAYACKQIGLADAQIDLATLLTLNATWASRGDYFDARFDNFLTFWEAVSQIAIVGRAKPFMQGGMMRIARDGAQTMPVQMFSVRNICKGSFKIDYLMPTQETADAIDVGYFDKFVWAPRRVRAKLTGSSASAPVKMNYFGVSERDQAFREGMYNAACNRYRRRIIKFETDMEGFIPSFLDLIAVQHDMPSWGQGGDVVAWNAGTNTVTVDADLTFLSGTNYIAFRKPDGTVDGPHVCTAGATANEAILQAAPSVAPYTGRDMERAHYAFGNGDAYMAARVIAIRPVSLTRVEIEAINEDDNVHTAETGQTAPARTSSILANYTSAPEISGLIGISAIGDTASMLLSWQPSPWADNYLIEQSADGVEWTRTGETRASNYTAQALYGAQTLIRLAAVGVARGPWHQINFGLLADYMWAANDTATVTISNASPAVISWTGHPFLATDGVIFATTGTLPSGLAIDTPYYVLATGLTADAFTVSATTGGAAINTTTAGSGVHTGSKLMWHESDSTAMWRY